MVNNTILFTRPGIANAVLVQLGQESVEMHNNVVHQTGSGAAPNILQVNEASDVETPYCAPTSREPWSSGRKVAGSNNWVQASATLVPAELSNTYRGTDPLLENIAQYRLRPLAASALVSAGNPSPGSPPGFPFPSPLPLPEFDPPQRMKIAIGAEVTRVPGMRIDIGAFESVAGGGAPTPKHGSPPLIPPVLPGGGAGPDNMGGAEQAATRGDTVRITPPILRLWWRLERLLDSIRTLETSATR